MKDELGDRMKSQYENRTKTYLPRRTTTIIRIDGKTFHTYTRGLKRPYDEDLMKAMDDTALFLCQQVQGCCLAYVQSDEISLALTDFATPETQAWFDGNVQKITSVSASIATFMFNHIRPTGTALFDSRVFTIPDPVEVLNYFIWRQQDAIRNSIQSAAQALFSQKILNGVNTTKLKEMMLENNVDWNDYPATFKHGRCVVKYGYGWEIDKNIPKFTEDVEYLHYKIPSIVDL